MDEISWKKNHNYLTLVSDHATSTIVWGAPGKNADTLDGFFQEIGPENTANIEAISMDMGAAFIKSAKANAPDAIICKRTGYVRSVGPWVSSTTPRTWQPSPADTSTQHFCRCSTEQWN